jgi:hypothetical protein
MESLHLSKLSPAPGNSSAPENCRYHAASKVLGLSQIHWLSLLGVQPIVAHGVGVPSDQITTELSMSLRDETAANQILWF